MGNSLFGIGFIVLKSGLRGSSQFSVENIVRVFGKDITGNIDFAIFHTISGCGLKTARVECRRIGLSNVANSKYISRRLVERLEVKLIAVQQEYKSRLALFKHVSTLGTVKAIRIRTGFPVNGQRTVTNGRTAALLNKRRF